MYFVSSGFYFSVPEIITSIKIQQNFKLKTGQKEIVMFYLIINLLKNVFISFGDLNHFLKLN